MVVGFTLATDGPGFQAPECPHHSVHHTRGFPEATDWGPFTMSASLPLAQPYYRTVGKTKETFLLSPDLWTPMA